MKHEWRKHEKALYGATIHPTRLNVPSQQFLLLDGVGDPNGRDFSERVSALYAASYAVKRLFRAAVPKGAAFEDFTVYPLEGLWTGGTPTISGKAALRYRIMIRQPDAVSAELVHSALIQAAQKKPWPHYDAIRFESLTDGDCVQVLHIGSYDTEPHTFATLDAYLQEHHLTRANAWHREIYLSQPGRVAPEKQKTILRVAVQPKEDPQ